MTISAQELAYILSIKVDSANSIIALRASDNIETARMLSAVNSNLKIPIELLKGVTIIDLEKAIEDIRENSMTRPAFRKWLMVDHPLSKIAVSRPPKTVRLPRGLRSLLKEKDLLEIEAYWNNRFANVHFSEWNQSVDYYPILKP